MEKLHIFNLHFRNESQIFKFRELINKKMFEDLTSVSN